MGNPLKVLITLILNSLLGLFVVEAAMAQSFTIGQKFAGGIIFYVDTSGCHGLIAAPYDVRTSAPLASSMAWRIPGAYGREIGAGIINTLDMLTIKTFQAETAPYLCATFSNDGYNDWFLPSLDELDQLYFHKNEIGGFLSKYYWSSTVTGAYRGWAQHFMNGSQKIFNPNAKLAVRPIRAL